MSWLQLEEIPPFSQFFSIGYSGSDCISSFMSNASSCRVSFGNLFFKIPESFFMFSSLSRINLLRNRTSKFFFSRDYWAETIFLSLCLSFTSILSLLAFLSFCFMLSIFSYAFFRYTSKFSLLRPLSVFILFYSQEKLFS